jgi:acid phosphatase
MLAPSRSAWRIVVGHHPIRSGSAFHGPTPALQQHIAPLLQSMGVHAYLCGHEHDLQHLDADGLHYVVSGAGAEVRSTGSSPATRYCASTPGFAVVSLTAEAMRLRFCDADGEVIYETLVDRPAPVREPAA